MKKLLMLLGLGVACWKICEEYLSHSSQAKDDFRNTKEALKERMVDTKKSLKRKMINAIDEL